jgi:hypothetical protein
MLTLFTLTELLLVLGLLGTTTCLTWTRHAFWAVAILIAVPVFAWFMGWAFGSLTIGVSLLAAMAWGSGYLLTGLTFSVIKWWLLTRKCAHFVRTWIKRLGISTAVDSSSANMLDLNIDWQKADRSEDLLRVRLNRDTGAITLDWNKYDLIEHVFGWTVLWPIELLLTFMEDALREAISWLVQRFARLFRAIATSATSDIQVTTKEVKQAAGAN